jgi:glycosyltransferase involved in cell wall biosynthesis
MRICLVSRELYPYVGGGIAPIVAAQARVLSEVAEVVLVTTAASRADHERLVREGDPRLPPQDVELLFVDEPAGHDHGAYLSHMHAWSARVHAALREHYGDRGPDLIEFCDYLGEGFVTVQAACSHAPWLDETLVAVRLHTTSEMCNVLNGHLSDDFATTATHDLERGVLRGADRILWSGGDILETYRRFYGAGALAPAVRIPDGFFAYEDAVPDTSRRVGDVLKLLYVGRMERRKGVQNLVRAMTALPDADVSLTLLGGDTQTGPLQSSLRDQLLLMAHGDERIGFQPVVPRAEVPDLVREHDVVVVPSLWECWPNTAREALMYNRPVLATPVGGLVDLAVPGRSGWLTRDTTAEALTEAIARLSGHRDEVGELIAAGGPRRRFEELTDPRRLVERYTALLAEPRPRRRRPPPGRPAPLVSVIVPYFQLEAHLLETLDSIAAQTHPAIETIVVNDGSLREADAVLWAALERPGVSVVTQANAGLGAARNFGLSQATGRYLLPLDADDTIDPTFVARCVRALEADPALAYVTTWVEYMDEDGEVFSDELGGYMPLGNFARLMDRNNVAGTCSAVFRREVFADGLRYSQDLTSYEDWFLYWELRDRGRLGAIIPERLFRYRVRRSSMVREIGSPQVGVLFDEMRAHKRERDLRWTAEPTVPASRTVGP